VRKALLFIALFGLVSCQVSDSADPPPNILTPIPDPVWVATEPIQCLGNPWEQAWLEANDWNYYAYPKDPTKPGLEPEEVKIITDYYAQQDVIISEALGTPRFEGVCAACSCPEGHTLYLEVRAEDVEKMLSLGYREEAPYSAGDV
jgi:hypothetical protein